jgi:hypothetical protein
MSGFWTKFTRRDPLMHPLVSTYRALSSASADELWQTVVNFADVSWHPILARTNVPRGLLPKPGLIFEAVTRLSPIPIRIFVERVNPRELLSIRILAMPGVEERVIYRVESTLCGSYVSYSVTLKGWLSPLVWSIIRPYAEKVAIRLAHAAEQEHLSSSFPGGSRSIRDRFQDLLSITIMLGGVSLWLGHPMGIHG